MDCHVASGAVDLNADDVSESVKGIARGIVEQIEERLSKRPRGSYEQMRDLAKRYTEGGEALKPGDVVTWKPGMKNADFPEYGEPAAVLETDRFGRYMGGESTSAHYNEPRDIRIGVIVAPGAMQAFWYDSRRFKKFVPVMTATEINENTAGRGLNTPATELVSDMQPGNNQAVAGDDAAR